MEEIKVGSVWVFEFIQKDRASTHTEPKSADLRLMVSERRGNYSKCSKDFKLKAKAISTLYCP